MSSKKQRISILVTAKEKKQIKKRANEAELSVGDFIRLAAKACTPSDEDGALNKIIDYMLLATEHAEQAIDDTINYVTESNKRIEKLEEQRKISA